MNYNIQDFIGVFDDVMPGEYNDFIIQAFEEVVKTGMTYSRKEIGDKHQLQISDRQLFFSEMIYSNKFVSINQPFMEMFFQQAYPKYLEKYGILDKLAETSIYASKIQKTEKAEGYHEWHCEQGDRLSCQRVLSYIYYINDVPEGGETEFLYLSKRIQAKAGRLVIFPCGFTHTHRGNPPLSNTKYILTGHLEF